LFTALGLALLLWGGAYAASGIDRKPDQESTSSTEKNPQTSEKGLPSEKGSSGDSAKTKETQDVSDRTEGLTPIGEYKILTGTLDRVSRREGSTEVFNPFLSRKSRRFHGSVYLYHRNDFLDARNFFDPVGEKLPEFKRNQFGLTLGTVLPGEVNLFGSYDGLRIIQGSTILSHVPTPQMKMGDFSALDLVLVNPYTGEPLPGNRIPQGDIHPVSKLMLETLPDPYNSDPDRNFINSQPEVSNNDTVSIRADKGFRENSTLTSRYSISSRDGFDVDNFPTFGAFEGGRHQEARISLNQRFSERLSGEFFTSFERGTFGGVSVNSGQVGLLESLGISGVSVEDPIDEGYPEFRMSGYTSFGDDEDGPRTVFHNWFVFGSSLSYAMEDHTLYFGGHMASHQVNNDRTGGTRRGAFNFNGSFTGDAFADFLYGIPDSAERGVGGNRSDVRSRRWEFNFTDSWKIHPNLRLSTGVRYSYFQPYQSMAPNVSTFHPLLFEPPREGEILIAGSERAAELGFGELGSGGLVFPDFNNWAPRLSVSYNPFGSHIFVMDASYSIRYSPPESDDFIEMMTRNYPFFDSQTSRSSDEFPELDLASPFDEIAPVEKNIRGISPYLRIGNVQRWRLGAESRMAQTWTVSASYRGEKGTGMQRKIPGNVPLPGPGSIQPRRPNPEYGNFRILTDGASFSQHTLDLELEKRLTDGFSLESGFRWSRHLTDRVWGDPSNPRDLASERSPASWMPEKRFDLRYIYDLPFGRSLSQGSLLAKTIAGWRLSGITRLQSGNLFSVEMPGDPNNDGVYDDRPDRTGPGFVESPTVDKWFETEDFASPELYGFGDAGRSILHGPGYQNWDVALSKITGVADGHFIELRFQMFNAFNHANFHRPDNSFGTSVFGKVFGASRAREIEVALKYSF
jgi:hypothetical protein